MAGGSRGSSGHHSQSTHAANIELEAPAVLRFVAYYVIVFSSVLLAVVIGLTCLRSIRRDGSHLGKGSALTGRCLRLRYPEDGIFAAREFRSSCNHVISLLLICLLMVPVLMQLACWISGVFVAELEEWRIHDGVGYIMHGIGISGAALTDAVPTRLWSRVTVLILAILSFVLSTFIIGLTSALRFVTNMANVVPVGFFGFLVLLLVLVPATLSFTLWILSFGRVFFEGFSLKDAFWITVDNSVAGGNLNLAVEQLRSLQSPRGKGLAILIGCWVLCLTGAVIGVVGAHPFISRLMAFLEGEEGASEEAVARAQEAVKRRIRLEKLRKRARLLERELQFARQDQGTVTM